MHTKNVNIKLKLYRFMYFKNLANSCFFVGAFQNIKINSIKIKRKVNF